MEYKDIIYKTPVKYGLINYENTYKDFNWETIKNSFDHFSGDGVNIAHEAIDRHAENSCKDKIALHWEDEDNVKKQYTFSDIKRQSDKLANVLMNLGVEKGDRIFLFLPRIPELYISIIAIAKIGAIAGPMFSAFGPDAVRDRLQNSEANVLITTPELKERVDTILWELPKLERIVLVNNKEDYELEESDVCYKTLIKDASDKFNMECSDLEDPLYILYTSGTTE